MLIAYDTRLTLSRPPHTLEPDFTLSQGPGSGLISLHTQDFQVTYRDGKAEMYLSRHLTAAQLRQLAEIASSMASEIDAREQEIVTLSQNTQTISLPPDVVFSTVAVVNGVVGHGG